MIDRPDIKIKLKDNLNRSFLCKSDILYNLYGKNTLKHWESFRITKLSKRITLVIYTGGTFQ